MAGSSCFVMKDGQPLFIKCGGIIPITALPPPQIRSE
eukprot:CAMPEP_0172910412 /NCGR_PEP_ID=MMETSP1075-20121228/184585_1 /TAXON_ID=2916 /ORGANISM="Ceratium fusus, Strain PA161109" /LENGTH=36 /DNA_ID= /DNA_START= /DNA_END= /DNA_ORIENTATION=